MPDFDNLGNPIIKPTTLQPFDLTNPASKVVPVPNVGTPLINENTNTPEDGTGDIFDILSKASLKSNPNKGVLVTNKELQDNKRYEYYNPTVDNYEDFAANGQSAIEKARNGVLKGANLAATTVLGGFAMVGGAAKAALPGGKLSDIWDNVGTRALDAWNEKVDNEYLPNYQTDAEKNAAWYQKDYWMTSNFLFDTLIKNSGFAVGAMISGNIASAALKGIGAGLGTLAAEAAIAGEASQGFKVFTPLLRNTARAFSAAKNIEAAAILEKEITSVIDLESRVSQLAEIARQTNQYAKIGDKVHRSIIAAYSSAGEASFEALATAKEYRNNLIEKYKNEHFGEEPPADVLKNINNTAEGLGKTSFFGNLALLGLTEYAQLPKLIGSTYAAEKQAANSLLGMAEDVIIQDGKYVRIGADASKLSKGFQATKRRLGYIFDPKEGAQELGQYALQVGATNYYDKAFVGKEANVWTDGFLYGLTGVNERGEDVGALTSKEGIIGGITGAITGGVMSARSEMKQHRAVLSNTDKFIEQLDNAPIFKAAFKDRLNHSNRAIALQEEQEAATLAGDKLQAKDLNTDLMHNYLAPRIKYGRFDMVMADISDMKSEAQSQGGLPALQEQGYANKNDTVDSFVKRLDNLQRVAEETNEIYKSHDLRYSGQALTDKEGNPIMDEKGNPIRKYSPEIIDKLVYASSKIVDYDHRIPQVSAKLSAYVDPMTIAKDSLNKDYESYTKAIADISALDIREEEKTGLLEDLKDVVDLTQRRDSFLKEYKSIVDNPKLYERTPEVETEELPKDKETIKITTKGGERDIEIGTEYVLGKVVKYTKSGKEVYRQPKLTILGKNEDGTIKIKQSNGIIKDVSPEDIESYSLTPASELETNRKFKFFYEHQNSVFIHRKYKDANGNPVKGRLTYNKKDKRKLNFVYRDKNGKLKSVPAWNFMFKARKGYKQPMIEMIGTLTADQRTAQEKFVEEQEADIAARTNERFEIMAKLVDDVAKRHERVTKLIDQNQHKLQYLTEELAEVEAQIAEAPSDKRYKKFFRFKTQTAKAIGIARDLSRSIEKVEAEIAALEEEQEELEYTKDYVEGFAINLEEMPHLGKDMMFQLKYEALVIQDTINSNVKTISHLKGLVNDLEKAMDSAIKMLTDLLHKFGNKFPNVPAPNGQPWVDFLKENPNFLKNKPTFKTEYNELEDYLSYVEDTEITPNENRIKEVKEHIEVIEGELRDLDKHLTAHNTIVERFQQVAQEYRAMKREEAEQQYNEALKDAFIGINDNSIQNTITSGEYEPIAKKNDQQVVSSTTVPVSDKDHHVRADEFAEKFNRLENKDELRGIVVTHANEDLILPGLTDFLATDPTTKKPIEGVDPKKTVALVFVRDTEDGPVLVDKDGNDIDEEDLTKLDKAIFQTFPSEDLENTYGSMFRSTSDPEEVKAHKDDYKKWRDSQLDNDKLGNLEEVSPSFGILDYVTYSEPDAKTGKPIKIRDYASRIPVLDSGLVSEDDLQANPVVMVGIEDTISNDSGTQEFENAKGKVFLRSNGGLIPLDNRKFTSKEVDVMFVAMLQASKNAVKDGNLKSVDTQRFFQWLRSVSYWGTAKDQDGNRKEQPGYNNIWFDNVIDENGKSKTMLFISGKGFKVDFTPTALAANSDVIKSVMRDLYFNTRAPMVNNNETDKWNTPYHEMIGIDKEGNPITLKWQNYQSFLLSPMRPTSDSDGKLVEKRPKEDIPLTTNVRPLLGPEDRNRKQIYFTMNDVYESSKPVKKAPKPSKKKGGKKGAKKGAGGTKTGIYLDGTTPNQVNMAKTDYAYTIDINDIEDINDGAKVFAAVKFENDEYAEDIILDMAQKGLGLLDFTSKKDVQAIQVATAKKIIPLVRAEYLAQMETDEDPVEEPEPEEETENEKEEEEWEDLGDEEEQDTEEEEEDKETEDEDDEEWSNLGDDFYENGGVDLDEIEADEDTDSYRVSIEDENQYNLTPENWNDVEAFVKRAFPNVPFYRVKNIIQATNGRQAWGMYQDGAIYVYENAEVGTAYHEIFEAVWKMAASYDERLAINKEFRERKGSFTDRETGRTVEYSQASNHQIKEQLAEDFRDYVLTGKAEPKSLLKQLFDDLINFIKTFFSGKDAEHNTNELFKKIGNGFYSQFNPYETRLSYAQMGIQDIEEVTAGPMAEYRLEDISVAQQNEILQHMTFTLVKEATQTNKGLFDVIPENKKELYTKLYKAVQGRLKTKILAYAEHVANKKITKAVGDKKIGDLKNLARQIESSWVEIVKKHENHIKAYDISFDDADEDNVTSDDRRKDDAYGDSRQIDSFRKATGAVKLLLSTLPEMEIRDGKPKPKLSSIGGNIILPGDRVFITLMNQLYDSINPDDMLNKLRLAALKDINYVPIYYRLTGTEPQKVSGSKTVPVNYKALNEYDLRLITAFWKTMKKQNADAITVFVLPSGEVSVSDSTLTSAAKQSKRDMSNKITDTIKSGESPFFSYERGKYNPTNTVKKHELKPSDLGSYIRFLEKVGITFTEKELKALNDDNVLKLFRENVERMKRSFTEVSDLVLINPQTLKIDGRLFNLGVIKATIENPEFESTYFNINGDKTQTFLGTNIISSFHDIMSKVKKFSELTDNPLYSQYAYLKTDAFAQGSQIIGKMFTDKGTRRSGTEDLFKSVYIDGTINEETGKKTESSKLTYKQRLVQEINLNLNGVFMNLVPGDASIEWGIKMYNGDSPFIDKDGMSSRAYEAIFKDYFIAEAYLARDNRKVVKHKDRTATDLRFFKDILSAKTYTAVMKDVSNNNKTPLEAYEANKKDINKDVLAFIKKEADKTFDLLGKYQVIEYTENDTMKLNSIELPEYNDKEDMMKDLEALATNYMISNIEMHKLIYSDPYQYADELKRIKNFNSPRQPLIFGSELINAALNITYNQGYDESDIAYTDMNADHFRTVTASDVNSDNPNKDYDDPYKETDGGGYITMKANRVFGIRSGEWTSDNERQYRYDMAYEKFFKGQGLNEKQREARGITMSKQEIALFEAGNPGVKDTYTPKKPIAAGNKAYKRDYNDIVLHKYALVPISFRIQHELNPDSNMIRLYNKMQAEDIDYLVFDSGSKVGTEAKHDLYNKDGSFNDAPFETQEQVDNPYQLQGVTRIPFAILSVQSEVPSKDTPLVRQGTQITKLATMDFMEAGVPIDFMGSEGDFNKRFASWNAIQSLDAKMEASSLYKEIINNQRLLEAKIEEGYNVMLKQLGIKEKTVKVKGVTKKAFELSDPAKLVTTLRAEVLKREINENIIYAVDDLDRGAVIIEATPVYQQIRNILFSIADKNVVKPKISGGMKVQIPSTLLESNRVAAKDVNGKMVYESNVLDFYSKTEDGKTINVCEVMVGRWFKSDLSDEDLLKYLNETDEGQKILNGVGFRIPTQKQNSIDVFKIKKFLPKDFGDSVVIPSALVKKAGSDFDIDKLSIYLKNTFKNSKGNPQIVPYLGTGQEAKDKFAAMFDKGEFLTKGQFDQLQKNIRELKTEKTAAKAEKVIEAIFGDLGILTEEDILADLLEEIDVNGFKNTLVDSMYLQSLENEYIESLEKLISRPENFDNLVKPNDASQLSDLAKVINGKLGRPEIDYSSPGNMLSRAFMSSLRQAFVSGKYAIGIAAVGQTGHAQRQRTPTYIDIERMEDVPQEDQEILGADSLSAIYANNPNINFEKYNSAVVDDSGVKKPVMAMIKNAAGDYISDINGMFIDGYVDISKGPWIMELGATPNVTSTWLFLVDLGVPINTVAFFMNQPIIKDYLTSLENQGYSWLFIKPTIEAMLLDYSGTLDSNAISKIPSETSLGKTVGMDKSDMNPQQLAEQQFILKEFLKYAKLASHQFAVTQGSNFDTATLNDPYLIFKKMLQYEKGRRTLISSIDTLTDASFVGVLRDIMQDVRDAMSTVLLSDRNDTKGGKTSIRSIMEEVLMPFVDMSDRDFVKISQKAVSDLFDWAIQTEKHGKKGISMNVVIADVLLGSEKEETAAKEIIEFRDAILKKPNHPLNSNMILRSLRLESGNKKADPDAESLTERKGKPDNLSITAKDGKAFNQDLIIGAFKELRDNSDFAKTGLYDKLVRVAILQSGLTNSPISFSHLLPYEDFRNVYNATLSTLETMPGLDKYLESSAFQRNNWANTDIVPQHKAIIRKSKKTDELYNANEAFVDKKLQKTKELIPKVITISKGSVSGRSDFITYSWTDEKIKAAQRKEMRKKGDYSYINKMLMQKVYTGEVDKDGNRIPLIQKSNYEGRDYYNYIYKGINAWGDSFRAKEFYSEKRPSVIDNGYVTVVNEVEDVIINNIMNGIPNVQEAVDNKEKAGVTTTPVANLNARLGALGAKDLVLSPDFFKKKVTGRLNSFRSSVAQVKENLQILEDLNLKEFAFITPREQERLDALRPKVAEFRKLNMEISSKATRTEATEKKYAKLQTAILAEFMNIVGRHVQRELGGSLSLTPVVEKTAPAGKTPIKKSTKKC